MNTRVIEIYDKQIVDGQQKVITEYNEYDSNNQKVRTASRVHHFFPLEISDADIIEWVRVNEYQLEKYKDLEPTEDVYIYIEERRPPDYIRYVSAQGKRWEVIGVCTNVGNCWEGAVGGKPELDCPFSPEYKGGCCPMTINVLPDAN